MSQLYIGLMTGTSCDAIDAALVDFTKKKPHIIATHSTPMPSGLRSDLLTLASGNFLNVEKLYTSDVKLGEKYALTIIRLLKNLPEKTIQQIKAIGCHGQTIRHQPNAKTPYTVQIGDPNILTAKTGIITVADFRRKDIAQGGQGAPFAPAFHQSVFQDQKKNRVIINIGGISNISIIQPNGTYQGFDTGPGNILLDAWTKKIFHSSFDNKGSRARTGKIDSDLLNNLLSDKFFKKKPPKSTGRDYFNLDWLNQYCLNKKTILNTDILCTLTELTAASIVLAIKSRIKNIEELYICGGGAKNNYLLERIAFLSNSLVKNTAELGISSDWVECCTFAWMAKQTLNKIKLDFSSLTGSKKPTVFGGIYYP